MRLENKASDIIKLAKDLASIYQPCFCHYSEELYVRNYAKRRLETIMAINKDDNGIEISKKNQKLFIDTFVEAELKNIARMKADFNKKEKKEIKKHGVKRKPQK